MFRLHHPLPNIHPSQPEPLPPPPRLRMLPARSLQEGSLLVLDGEWVSVVHVDGHDLVRVSWVSFDGREGSRLVAGGDLVQAALP